MIHYRVMIAADVENGKVIDLDFYVLARGKNGKLKADQNREAVKMVLNPKRVLNWVNDREELLARRSPVKKGDKVPKDIDEKFKEYSILYPANIGTGPGPERSQFMNRLRYK